MEVDAGYEVELGKFDRDDDTEGGPSGSEVEDASRFRRSDTSLEMEGEGATASVAGDFDGYWEGCDVVTVSELPASSLTSLLVEESVVNTEDERSESSRALIPAGS